MSDLNSIKESLKSPDDAIRRNGVEMLAEIGGEEAVKLLLSMIGDPAWQVRNTAVEALVFIRDKYSIQPLVNCLEDDDVSVRNSAMTALAELGEDVVEPLCKLLETKKTDARIFAANTLGNLGSKKAVNSLIATLNAEDENVQYAVVEALGRIKDSRAVKPLLDIINPSNPWQAFPIITALGEIGDPEAANHLVKFINDEFLMLPIISALGNMGDIVTFPYLYDILLKSSDEDIIIETIKSIYKIHERNKILSKLEENQFLINYIPEKFSEIDNEHILKEILRIFNKSDDIELKRVILKIIPWFSIKIDISEIVYAFSDYELRDDAVETLIQLGNRYLPELKNFVTHPDPLVREKIAEAYVIAIGQNVTNELNILLDDNDEYVKIAAINSVGVIGDIQFLDKLVDMLDTDNYELKDAIAGALMLLGDKKVAEKMKNLLKDENPNKRQIALKVLGIIDLSEYIEDIFMLINDEESFVRAEAVATIGKISRSSRRSGILSSIQIDILKNLVYDESAEVRESAVVSLGRILESDSVDFFISLLDAEDMWTQYFAVQILEKFSKDKENSNIKPKIIEALLKKFVNEDTQENIKVIISEVLGNIDAKESINTLKDYLYTNEITLLCSIIESLGKLKAEECVNDILSYIDNPCWEIKNAAIKALFNMNYTELSHILIKLLSDDSEYEGKFIIEKTIISNLQNIEFKVEYFKPLLRKLVDKDGKINIHVHNILFNNYKKIFNEIINSFDNESNLIKALLIILMGKSCDKSFYEILSKQIDSKVGYIRLLTVFALHKINIKESVDLLIKAKEHEEEPLIKWLINKLLLVMAKNRPNS